ncbi:MAG: DNA cytosine methyltransferase [Candidatus Eisenbacteria bacterium]
MPVRSNQTARPAERHQLTVAGLFAGIGGIELGLDRAGHNTALLCEIDPGASRVLRKRFPSVPLVDDVRAIEALPRVDLVAAGFPCQDLSQAGKTAGIRGEQSGLVGQVFRLLDSRKRPPKWLLLENVSFMLQLDRGRGMTFLVNELERRGFSWAYRIVDTRSFGLPQRRQRVILLASKSEDPRSVLLTDDAGPGETRFSQSVWCGFYWTEGLRGLGWAIDAVPTLKGGSTVGIPSPPAIWDPRGGDIMTPEIRDAERLQGFDADWTHPALDGPGVRRGHRWKLVGNAVSVPVAAWVGERLARPARFSIASQDSFLDRTTVWPKAAWGHKGKVYPVHLSMWPVRSKTQHLADFLEYPLCSLSPRAAAGFLSRAETSSLRFEKGFLDDVRRHIERTSREAIG